MELLLLVLKSVDGNQRDDQQQVGIEQILHDVESRQSDAALFAHFLGNGICHNDGHSVVGGGDVHGANQQAADGLRASW